MTNRFPPKSFDDFIYERRGTYPGFYKDPFTQSWITNDADENLRANVEYNAYCKQYEQNEYTGKIGETSNPDTSWLRSHNEAAKTLSKIRSPQLEPASFAQWLGIMRHTDYTDEFSFPHNWDCTQADLTEWMFEQVSEGASIALVQQVRTLHNLYEKYVKWFNEYVETHDDRNP